jgi:hypothetical protein
MKTLLVTILSILLAVHSNAQEKRLALVIGNADYPNGSSLKNPVNDANLMASTLENLGFDVMKHVNTSKSDMERAIYEYSIKLKDYKVALFYYAGHGILVDGVNYLIPTDAILEQRMSTQFEAVDIAKLINQFEEYKDNINIVILDACRNNPYRSWTRGAERGMRPIVAPSGTIIGYATGIGDGAADGKGENGLYTSKLIEQMKIPQRIEDVFINTRIAVRNASLNEQSPQEWSQLTGSFYFKEKADTNIDRVSLGSVEEVSLLGNILLTMELGGDLYLDGQLLGTMAPNSRLPINDISVGFHVLEIKGEENWRHRFYVRHKETVALQASLSEDALASKENLKLKIELGVSVSKLLEDEYSILDLLKAGIPESDFYGARYMGGRIFSINVNDGSGLVADKADLGEAAGSSWQKAKDLANNLSTEGYADWYLPSKAELDLLFKNLKEKNEGNFTSYNYWSSTQGERSTNAWKQDFSAGYQHENYTYLKQGVRAIRAFKSDLSNSTMGQ